jgi:hypothetical protein
LLGGAVQSAQGLCQIIFLECAGVGGWVGEPCVVCDAYLFLLQFHTGGFVSSCQGEMALLFSVWHGLGRLSSDKRSRMSQSLILIDALSSTC